MRFLKLLAALVLLPLLIAIYGAWQKERAGGLAPSVEQQRKDIDFQIAKMKFDQLRNPWAGSFRSPDGHTYGGPLAIQKLQEYRAGLETNAKIAAIRHALPWWTITLALSTVAIGLASLLTIGFFGQVARLSRRLLFVTFSLGHRLLPFVLSLQMLLIAGAMTAALGYEILGYRQGVAFLSFGDMRVATRPSTDMKIVAALLFAAVVMPFTAFAAVKQLKMARVAFNFLPVDVLGRTISPNEAPKLWSFVRELAQRMKALAPDNIVVGLTQGFFVISSAISLHPEDRELKGRTLYLHLPSMVLLDLKEITAIVGHELAHFSGADTEYSERFAPIYAATQRNLNAIYRTMSRKGVTKSAWLENIIVGPAYMLGLAFMQQFNNAVQYWSRKREFAADAAGAEIVGSQAAASALVRTSIILPRIGEVLTRAHEHPEGAPNDLLTEVVRVAREKGLDDPKNHLEEHLPHPTDSHPPTSARILALGETIDDILLLHATRPVALGSERVVDFLFDGDAAVLSRQLSADLTGAVKQHNAQIDAALAEQAGSVTEEIEIHEDTRGQVRLFRLFFWVTLLGVSGMIGYDFYQNPTGSLFAAYNFMRDIILSSIVVFFLAGCLLLIAMFKRRSQNLVMRLAPSGISFSNVTGKVPWTHIANMHMAITEGYGITRSMITFWIEQEAPLPVCAPRRLFTVDVRCKARSRKLLLTFFHLKSDGAWLRPEALLEKLHHYWDAARARSALEQRLEERGQGMAKP